MNNRLPEKRFDIGIMQADTDGLCRAASPELCAWLEIAPSDLVGHFIFSLIAEASKRTVIAAWEDLVRSKEGGRIEVPLAPSGGAPRGAVFTITPARGISALTDHWVIAVTPAKPQEELNETELKMLRAELTETRRRAEDQLSALREEITQVSRAKEVLLDSLESSHRGRIAELESALAAASRPSTERTAAGADMEALRQTAARLEQDVHTAKTREDALIAERNQTVSEITLRLEMAHKELSTLKSASPLASESTQAPKDEAASILRAENLTLTERIRASSDEITALRRKLSEAAESLSRLTSENTAANGARDALLTSAQTELSAKITAVEERLAAAAAADREKSAGEAAALQAELDRERTALREARTESTRLSNELAALRTTATEQQTRLEGDLARALERAAKNDAELTSTKSDLAASLSRIDEAEKASAESAEFAKTASREFKDILKKHDALTEHLAGARAELASVKQSLEESTRRAAETSTALRTAQKENSTLRHERDAAAAEAARLSAQSAEKAAVVHGTATEFFERIVGETALRLNRMLRALYEIPALEGGTPQRKAVTAARGAAEDLVRSLEEIHDFWELDTGHIELRREPFGLRAWLAGLGGVYEFKAAQRDGAFHLVIDPEIPDTVLIDGSRLAQVAAQSLDYLVETIAPGHTIELAVTANGLTAREARLTFEFTAPPLGGFGGHSQQLSLAVAERIVKLLGGSYTVVDLPGDRRSITFTLTLLRAAAGAAAAPPKRQRRLVREEIEPMPAPLQRRSARDSSEQKRDFGVDPNAVFEPSAAAVEPESPPAAAAPPKPPPLPDRAAPRAASMDSEPQPPREPPIVELEHEAPSDIESAPSDVATHAGDGESAAHATTAPPADVDAGQLRVLLAEDNRFNQKAVAAMLQSRGYAVTLAADGREALTHLTTSRFDFALIDCEMPVMDGYTAAREARAAEARSGRHTPMFAMTVYLDGDAQARCAEAGMDELLTKPVRPEPLFALIDRFLPRT